ncbi:MAG TPA: hypothetical protein VE620_14645 [Myxococcales bacterium]|jgi:hypothetical protein|nr:hypothetical protein [Myxococcales bacterium]
MRKLLGVSLVAAVALVGAPSPSRAAGGFKARGFFLPDGAVKVDDDRYRLPQPWEEAVRWYRATYPPAKFPRHTLRNQAGIRAMHIVNTTKEEWEGANLYETQRGEVRVYVMGKVDKPEEPSPPLPVPSKKTDQPRPRKGRNP